MKAFPFFFMLCITLGWGCQDEPTQADQSLSSESVGEQGVALPYEFRLDTNALRAPTTIAVPEDLVRKGPQAYRAYSLRATLLPILQQIGDTAALQLVFVCSDGYEANMSLADALAHDGYLAYEPATQKEGQGWPEGMRSKFAPYYLVWTDDDAVPNVKLSWPYAISSVRLSRLETEFADALPKDKSLLAGFALFKQKCIKCHAINRVGGNMGPEFNDPKNITEYWQKEDIWQFVRAPQSFRYNSKMPPLTDLKWAEFEQIYAYLQAMKGQHPPA